MIGLLLAPLEEGKDVLEFGLVGDVIEHTIFIFLLDDVIGDIIAIGWKLLHIGFVAELLQDGLAKNFHAFALHSLLFFSVDLFEYLLIL